MRQILAVAVLGASLAFSAVTAFANDRDNVPTFQSSQNEVIETSQPSMGSGITAPQPVQNPAFDMGSHQI
jgi:hypothetical protein